MKKACLIFIRTAPSIVYTHALCISWTANDSNANGGKFVQAVNLDLCIDANENDTLDELVSHSSHNCMHFRESPISIRPHGPASDDMDRLI